MHDLLDLSGNYITTSASLPCGGDVITGKVYSRVFFQILIEVGEFQFQQFEMIALYVFETRTVFRHPSTISFIMCDSIPILYFCLGIRG